MCYHKAVTVKPKLQDFLKSRDLDVEMPGFFEGYYHASGFNHPQVPVMTAEEPHRLKNHMWGLVPHWSRSREDAQQNAHMFLNVTSEKYLGTFKSFRRQRCLVFVDGFFEWQWKDSRGKEKVPFFIYHQEKIPLAFGGLYNTWVDRETGEAFDTYAVMTTPANVLMSEIHNNKKRMPFIVPEEHWGRWLDGSAADEQITDILKPLPDGVLTCHEISRNISKRGYDTNVPEIQAPVSAGTLF